MHELIKKRLDNWDLAKPIYKHIAEMGLLKDFPNIDLQKMLFNIDHSGITKLASVITGKKIKTLSEAVEAVDYFLALIFTKIRTEPGYLDLLKLITVIPLTPIPVTKDLTEPDLSTN